MLPEFHLLREVRLCLERVWNTMLTRGQRGPPYSPHALSNARCRDSTIGALEAHMKPLQQGWGCSTTSRSLPPTPRSFTTMECGFEVASRVTRSTTKWMGSNFSFGWKCRSRSPVSIPSNSTSLGGQKRRSGMMMLLNVNGVRVQQEVRGKEEKDFLLYPVPNPTVMRRKNTGRYNRLYWPVQPVNTRAAHYLPETLDDDRIGQGGTTAHVVGSTSN